MALADLVRTRFFRAALAASTLLAVACRAPADDESGSGADAIAEVPQTGVRDQKETGNCWLFATLGWVESLELGAAQEAGEETTVRHYSPTYLDYWDWYEKITSGQIAGKSDADIKEELDSGGSWGLAVELVSRWGLVKSKDVDPNERDADKALAALGAVSKSLASGALKNAAARKDRRAVRRELDKAFGFPSALTNAMEQTFGDGSKNLEDEGVLGGNVIRSAEDVKVRIPRADGSVVVRPLTDAIGERAGSEPDQRKGTYAFSVATFTDAIAKDPTKTRAYFARIQKVLHTKTAIPIGWYWADNGDEKETGRFEGVPTKPAGEKESTSHLSILDDYQAEDVPGFGTLKAGVDASPEAREAALASEARVTFLRIKNSYGARTKNTKARPKGYDDLYASYLLGMLETCPEGVRSGGAGCEKNRGLEDVALPAGF